MDYYAVLGLGRDAQADAIASAYRRSALASNPESNQNHPDPAALAKTFKLVSQAYFVLSDPKTRGIYDQYGEDGVRHGGTGKVGVPGGVNLDEVDPFVVFRRFFGVDNPFQVLGDINGVQNNQHQFFSLTAAVDKNPPKAPPVDTTMTVTLEDVFYGNVRQVTWTKKNSSKRGDVLGTEEMSFEVAVPKGIRAGDTMTLLGKGNTREGCSQGDVIVTFAIEKHATYGREGDDLVVTAPISLVEALCGADLTVETIEGRKLPLHIDEIVHPQYRHVITGEGLPVYKEPGKRGNLVVVCPTQFPRYLSAEQKTELKRILESEQH